jgi:hypothetical protein
LAGFFHGRNIPGNVGKVSSIVEILPTPLARFLPRKKYSRQRRQGFFHSRNTPDTAGTVSSMEEEKRREKEDEN